MSRSTVITLALSIVVFAGCTSSGGFDTGKALTIGAGALQASLLDEESVRQAASLSATAMDARHQLAPPGSRYAQRLARLTSGLGNYDGMRLDFKVYLTQEINAFAMADGTVRVYAGLLDAMPDDQVLAVISHEMGHVKLKHSYRQMREIMLTNIAFDAAGAVSETIANLTASQLGELGRAAAAARFSQADELESDSYAVRALKLIDRDPYAMQRSIETLQQRGGSGGGFLSSHPSNQKRIENIRAEIARQQ